MVVAGSPSERDQQRLDHLAAQLRDRRSRVRFFTYSDTEVLAERLAALLLERLGRHEIEQRYFVGVPRGGLIVLGMVAYALGLHRDQLAPADRDGRAVVLVDDVSLTGHSLVPHLRKAGPSAVVALLAAQAELRQTLELDENVSACLAAVDLGSLLDGLPTEVANNWRAGWRQRLKDRPLAGSFPEPVAFPWSEPDSLLWDESSAKVEGGWQLVSPEHSLKSRAGLGPPSSDRHGRTWRFPDDIAYGTFDDGALLICRTTTEEVFWLDAVAAEIWGTLGTLGSPEAAIRHLLTQFDAGVGSLTADVNALVERFTAAGLLIPNSNR